MLRVRLFGVPSPQIPGGMSLSQLGRSGQLLAGYLFSFVGKTYRREFLEEEFWGDLGEARARAAMNTALWRIRKLLLRDPDCNGECNLVVKNAQITLQSAGWMSVDALQFASEAQRLLSPTYSDEQNIESLRACAKLYAGQFLEGESAEWAVMERERLERIYVRVLSLLGNRLTRAGRLDEAIAVANQILAADPFREATHRDLIVALALNEQRAMAIRQFERLRCLLGEELGLTPMRETAELVAALRSDTFREHFRPLQSTCFLSSSLTV